MKTKKVYSGAKWERPIHKEGMSVKSSRELVSLEKELMQCENLLSERFERAFVVVPGIQGNEVYFGGILFEADESQTIRLKKLARKINSRNTLSGTINVYNPRLSEGYWIFELRPYHHLTEKNLREETMKMANAVVGFLKDFCKYRK